MSTGGIEENGPYLATGKHNLILEAICPAMAEKLGNALCAPVVKFVPQGNIDPPSGAMKFPGSISLTAQWEDGNHDDIWVTAMMMVTDPEQVRFAQRVDTGLASINGVSIVPMEETVELGRKMVEFRAGFTANAIRRILSESRD